MRLVFTMNAPSSMRISPVNVAIFVEDIIQPVPRLRKIAGPLANSALASANGISTSSSPGRETGTLRLSRSAGEVRVPSSTVMV